MSFPLLSPPVPMYSMDGVSDCDVCVRVRERVCLNQVSQGLGLVSIKDRQWHLCKSSAINGEGLNEGLDWLATAIAASTKQ